MAHHASAKKRIRRNERRAAMNKARRSRVRTFIKRVEKAIETGDKAAALAEFRMAEPEIRRGVTKGVLHLNTASRKISRLSKKIKDMPAGAPA